LTVSLSVIATLMVATGSIMVLTGRAVGMTAMHASEVKIDDLAATIASEVRLALTVTEHTPTSITFTVADRDGDGVPETIRYSWSGKENDPITRQLNAGPAVVVSRNVRKFKMGFVTRSSAPAGPVPQVESTTDELLYSHDGGTAGSYPVTPSAWCSQKFSPQFSRPDVSSWRVTRIEVWAFKPSSNSRTWKVQLREADTLGRPTMTVIEERSLSMSSLSTTPKWAAVAFSVNTGLDPSKRYCIVFGQSLLTGQPSGTVVYDSAGTGGFATSLDGMVWGSPSSTRELRLKVYGRYKYPSP
jgi:hypothetical protein